MVESRSRRTVLKTVGSGAAFALTGCIGGDDNGEGDGNDNSNGNGNGDTTDGDVSGSLKIGVVHPLTGPAAAIGTQALQGLYSGFAYKLGTDPNADIGAGSYTVGDGNLKFEVFTRDSQFDPNEAQRLAANLVQEQKVDILIGATSTSSTERILQQVVDPAGIPLLCDVSASASLTRNPETCSNLFYHFSENSAMDARAGGEYIAQYTDISSAYIVAADYSYGRSIARNYTAVLEKNDIEITGEQFVPQGYQRFGGVYETAQDSGADAIIGSFSSVTMPDFLRGAFTVDHDMRVTTGITTEPVFAAAANLLKESLGSPLTADKIEEAKFGPFSSRYHWNQYDNAINDEFVEMYMDTYDAMPDLYTSSSFTTSSALVQAIQESSSTEPSDIVDALKGMVVQDTPKGEGAYVLQKYNNKARSPMTVSNMVPNEDVNLWDAGVMLDEPDETIDKDQTTIPGDSDLMDCSL